MTELEFAQAFKELCEKVEATPVEKKYLFQKDLHRLVEQALSAGVALPDNVKSLDEQLTNAAIEAQFDNMPV